MTQSPAEILIVVGATGEYSEHSYWFVGAFQKREDVDVFVDAANAWLREHGLHEDDEDPTGLWISDGGRRHDQVKRLVRECPFDPNLRVSDPGTSYSVHSLPILKLPRSLRRSMTDSRRES
jgi:hypothetical protein